MDRLEARGFHFYEGGEKWIARGVTYGPFAPNGQGFPYPAAARLREDFAAIRAAGANCIRLYALPGEDLPPIAAEYGLRLLVDIPWPKHLDVYEDEARQALCLRMVEEGIERIARWPNLLGVFLGNEIPPDLVRWHGAGRVEGFLRRLYRRAKALAPDLPIGYANYPSTEYLEPGFFDFLGFNVYLHEAEDFRRYLTRLRLLHPEKPLLLSEIGMDTMRHGEAEQAEMLRSHLGLAYEAGLAGAFVFGWTDEWHTGGFEIEDWAFGVVDRERRPKPALAAVADVFARAPRCAQLERWPSVSVVVATYNGGRTLRECLLSLGRLNYPDYEVVVVDDGSTDQTQEILREFPAARVVSQENRGLSAARNAGIEAARGEIVAFTDSDCYADPDWLHHLVVTMEECGFAGAGGPNLTPGEERAIARSIALAPGHATHVLLNDREAEHVPGCNMAFRRERLLALGGFQPLFRKAGDDVDMIWRLQDQGEKIGFSTGGFVWHHRRPTFKGYLKQQTGYGEAEALLLREHPQRFNERGQSIWRGVIYASRENLAPFIETHIHYGVYGSGGFQCVYGRPAGTLAYGAVSVEWWLLAVLLVAFGGWSTPALWAGLAAMGLSLGLSGIKAWRRWRMQAEPAAGLLARAWLLWTLQPIVRGGARYWYRWRTGAPPQALRQAAAQPAEKRTPAAVSRELIFWGEPVPDRVAALDALARRMGERRWFHTANSGWERWDLSLVVSWWFKILIASAGEDHGQERRMLRMRLRLAPTSLLKVTAAGALLLCAALALQNTLLARLVLMGFLCGGWWSWRQALRRRTAVEELLVGTLQELGYGQTSAGPAATEAGRPETEAADSDSTVENITTGEGIQTGSGGRS